MKWTIEEIEGQWRAKNGLGVTVWADTKEKLVAWLYGDNSGRQNGSGRSRTLGEGKKVCCDTGFDNQSRQEREV